MRTMKSVLCLAAMVAGVATAVAQSNVYSLNVVGYYNVSVPAHGYAQIANQLNTTNNTVPSLITTPNDGDQFYKYSGGYATYTYDITIPGWTPDATAVTLNPGEGILYKNSAASALQITFVGEVLQGTLNNTLPAGYAVRSSMVPVSGTLTGTLGVPAEDGDQAYVYNGGYATYTYDVTIPGWTPGSVNGPTVAIGQGFLYHKASTSTQHTWSVNFTVQ